MNDLITFVRARLDELEQKYRESPYADPDHREWAWNESGNGDDGYLAHENLMALRDIDLKRKTVALHDDVHECQAHPWSMVFPAGDHDEIACPTMRLLAAYFEDHEDYKPGWKPDASVIGDQTS